MKEFIKKRLPSVWDHLKLVQKHFQDLSKRKLRRRVEAILKCSDQPTTQRAESDFSTLQESYPEFPPYGYDDFSVWSRGASRALELLRIEGMKVPGQKILEVGCGDGLVSHWLKDYGQNVTLVDQDDWRHEKTGSLPFNRKISIIFTSFPKMKLQIICVVCIIITILESL